MNSETTLQSFLVKSRKSKRLTLRQVELKTDVSNAYLSQLENGKIKQPSPNILYQLSELYGVSYTFLMELAGYPVPGSKATNNLGTLYSRLGPTTPEEDEQLADYLQFLRSRSKRNK